MIEIRKIILANAEAQYAAFAGKLLPKVAHIAGVRLPKLRALAKSLAADKDAAHIVMNAADDELFEEKMLRGMIIGALKIPLEDKLPLVEKFVPQIDNWSVCDSFCSSLKIKQCEKPRFLKFLKKYIDSRKEFERRFGIVMLKNAYLTPDYIRLAADTLQNPCPDKYYAQMATAWTLCELCIKFPQIGMEILNGACLDETIKKMTLAKLRDSRRKGKQNKKIVRPV